MINNIRNQQSIFFYYCAGSMFIFNFFFWIYNPWQAEGVSGCSEHLVDKDMQCEQFNISGVVLGHHFFCLIVLSTFL